MDYWEYDKLKVGSLVCQYRNQQPIKGKVIDIQFPRRTLSVRWLDGVSEDTLNIHHNEISILENGRPIGQTILSLFQYDNSLFDSLVSYVEKEGIASKKVYNSANIAIEILTDTQKRKRRERVEVTEYDVNLAVKRIRHLYYRVPE